MKNKYIIATIVVLCAVLFIWSEVRKEKNASVSTSIPVEKSYQPVFTFNGSGTKKSEPFIITGSRFKIKYTCDALCSALLFPVDSEVMKASITGIREKGSDETIMYGKGEYYISMHAMGGFSIIVEDYR